MMEGLLISPNAFLNHFRRYVVLGLVVPPLMCMSDRFAAAMILKITYGHDVHSNDDHFIHLGACCNSRGRMSLRCHVSLAERAATLTVQSGSPAATLVDFFPALRFVVP